MQFPENHFQKTDRGLDQVMEMEIKRRLQSTKHLPLRVLLIWRLLNPNPKKKLNQTTQNILY